MPSLRRFYQSWFTDDQASRPSTPEGSPSSGGLRIVSPGYTRQRIYYGFTNEEMDRAQCELVAGHTSDDTNQGGGRANRINNRESQLGKIESDNSMNHNALPKPIGAAKDHSLATSDQKSSKPQGILWPEIDRVDTTATFDSIVPYAVRSADADEENGKNGVRKTSLGRMIISGVRNVSFQQMREKHQFEKPRKVLAPRDKSYQQSKSHPQTKKRLTKDKAKKGIRARSILLNHVVTQVF